MVQAHRFANASKRTQLLVMLISLYTIATITAIAVPIPQMTAKPTFGVSNIPTVQFASLRDLYIATKGSLWDLSDSNRVGNQWAVNNPFANPCLDNWIGIRCDIGQCLSGGDCNVNAITLQDLRLNGTLPASIGNISTLEQLKLGQNYLYGAIPETIGDLYNLSELSLGKNYFRGSLPDMFWKVKSLARLDLSMCSLTGTLPPSLYSLKAIREIDLTSCSMIGTLSGNLSNWQDSLEWLHLNGNNFTGTIPQNIVNLQRLARLDLARNQFHGTIPSDIDRATMLSLLDISGNVLTGSIPSGLVNLTRLTNIALARNQLTGTLPIGIFQQLPALERFNCFHNSLHGTIASVFNNKMILVEFVVSNNLLTGPVPNVWELPRLRTLSMFYNEFTGKMQPLQSVNIMSIDVTGNLLTGPLPPTQSLLLYGYWANGNFFTGSIPPNLIQLSHIRSEYLLLLINNTDVFEHLESQKKDELVNTLKDLSAEDDVNSLIFEVDFETNLLTGHIPVWITNSSILTYVALRENVLSGSLPEVIIDKPVISTLQLDHNRLEGSIPASFNKISTLFVLTMNDNVFTGTIPSFLFHNKGIREIVLQNNRFTGKLPELSNVDLSQLIDFDVSGNQLTGSISSSLFRNNNFSALTTFAASENCFTGSIPTSLCDLTYLQILELDGLSTAKTCRKPIFSAIPTAHSFTLTQSIASTIPICLFQMPNLAVLHLSGNGFAGSLQPGMTVSCALNTLVLSHNELTGKIPAALQQRTWHSIDLSYNKLTGMLNTDAFVRNTGNIDADCILVDSNNDANNTTTTSTEVYLDVNRLSGDIPSGLLPLLNVSILNGNMFECDRSDASTLPQHDPKVSSYDCGTDSVNRAMYSWSAMLGIVAVVTLTWVYCRHAAWLIIARDNVVAWQHEIHAIARGRVEVDGEVTYQHNNNPIYLYAKFFEVLRRYGLYLIVLYAVVMMPLYSTLSVFQGTYERSYAWKVSAAYLSGLPAGLVLMFAFMLIISAVYYLYHHQMSLQCDANVYLYSLSRSIQSMKNILRLSTSSMSYKASEDAAEVYQKDIETNILISVFNMAIITTINMVYITAILELNDTRNIELVRIAVTLLKFMWNDVGIWSLLSFVKYRRMAGIISDPEELRSHASHISHKNMFALTLLLLFNNIIAPCLSVAIINPNCFYNAFVPAGSVNSTYSYCGLYLRSGPQGVHCTRIYSNSVSYDPPFLYSYNCASLLPANYVQIYLYMMYLSGFIQPALQLCAKYICDHYLTEGSQTHRFVSKNFVPTLLLNYQPERISSKQANGWDFSRIKLIEKSRIVMSIVSYLTLLVSFGVIFPPLGIVIWISMCSFTIYRTLLLGHLLFETRQRGYDWYAKQICSELEGVPKLFVSAIYPMTFVASLLYACIVFDTIGNTNGYELALGPAALLMLYPLLISGAVRINWTEIQTWLRHHQASYGREKPGDDEKTTEVLKEVELITNNNSESRETKIVLEIETILNPIRSSREEVGSTIE